MHVDLCCISNAILHSCATVDEISTDTEHCDVRRPLFILALVLYVLSVVSLALSSNAIKLPRNIELLLKWPAVCPEPSQIPRSQSCRRKTWYFYLRNARRCAFYTLLKVQHGCLQCIFWVSRKWVVWGVGAEISGVWPSAHSSYLTVGWVDVEWFSLMCVLVTGDE